MHYLEKILEYPRPKEFLEWLVQLGLHEWGVNTLPALYKIFSSSDEEFDFMAWLNKYHPNYAGAIIDMFVKTSVPYFINSVKSESAAEAYVSLYFQRTGEVDI